jgi:hypothetical protein
MRNRQQAIFAQQQELAMGQQLVAAAGMRGAAGVQLQAQLQQELALRQQGIDVTTRDSQARIANAGAVAQQNLAMQDAAQAAQVGTQVQGQIMMYEAQTAAIGKTQRRKPTPLAGAIGSPGAGGRSAGNDGAASSGNCNCVADHPGSNLGIAGSEVGDAGKHRRAREGRPQKRREQLDKQIANWRRRSTRAGPIPTRNATRIIFTASARRRSKRTTRCRRCSPQPRPNAMGSMRNSSSKRSPSSCNRRRSTSRSRATRRRIKELNRAGNLLSAGVDLSAQEVAGIKGIIAAIQGLGDYSRLQAANTADRKEAAAKAIE